MNKEATQSAIEAIYPLSPMQQGMLFHTLYNPQAGLYFEQHQYTLHGALDIPSFKQSWEQIIRRHAILRTQFMWEDLDEPLQVVWQKLALPWSEYDLCEFSEQAQQVRITVLLQEDLQRINRLDQAPLFRLILLRLQPDAYHFIWSCHHALLDGWSTAIVIQEVLHLYEAIRQGQELALPDPPYRNYITWLQQQDRAQAEMFWREVLAGFRTPTLLQVGHTVKGDGPLGGEMEMHTYLKQLTPAATQTLQTFCRSHRITLNTLVQGCWALLLSYYSGEQDIVFGMVAAGRPLELAGAQDMVGLFINTLPVRVQIDPALSLISWLQTLQMQQVRSRQYDYCALTDMQKWSDLPPHVPMFESIIAFENYPGDAEALQKQLSLKIDGLPLSAPTNYPLCLAIVPDKELVVYLAHDRQRFDDAVAERLFNHFLALLQKMGSLPVKTTCGAISLLTAAEQKQVLYDWNDTAGSYRDALCIPDVFEAQVQEFPDAVALVFNDVHITYATLNKRANGIGHALQALGVSAETMVGLYCERSVEMVVGALGILKAGGAYVPLDPNYPMERLLPLLNDAGLALIIAQQSIAQTFPEGHAARIIPCDCADDRYSSALDKKNPPRAIVPDNSAYAIYTSGSTGKPKGVLVTHRGVCNLLAEQDALFHIERGQRILQFASQSFDVSIWEVWVTLMSGATLHLGTRDALMPGEPLAEVLQTQAISALVLTPSAMMALPDQEFPALQHVVTTGEVYAAELVERWKGKARFYNAYGPTETTCYSTVAIDMRETDTSLIGRPICNTQVYLLNKWLQPVPTGVSGEVYIGGVGLARGYMHQPGLTAERFIPNPFSKTPGKRLYRTGDLAQYTAEGQLIFLGRNDDQVKLRGFRIELGEIEKTLERHEMVRQCAVMIREDIAGDRSMVLYVVPQVGQSVDGPGLRNYLRGKLPSYMLPNAIIMLEKFPLTPNGKIDRRALPAPSSQAGETFQPPRDSVEQQLVQSVEEILQIHSVSITDNFFLLGGHSLSAIRLMNEIQKRLHVRVELPMLFQTEHIAALAQMIRQLQGAGAIVQSSLVAIRSRGEKAPLFFLYPASGNVSSYYNLARYLRMDRPIYGIQDIQPIEEGSKIQTLEEIAGTYITTLKEVQPQGPYLLGGYSFGGIVAFEIAQQLRMQRQEVALLAIFDSHPPKHPEDVTDNETTLLAIIASEWLRESRNKKVQEIFDELLPLSTEEQLQHVLSLVRGANVELFSTDPRWIRQQVLLFKRRMQMALNYKSCVYPGKITLFRAGQVDQLERNKGLAQDFYEQGWQEATALPLETHLIPGYHNTIMNNPSVELLAEKLQQCIDCTDRVRMF